MFYYLPLGRCYDAKPQDEESEVGRVQYTTLKDLWNVAGADENDDLVVLRPAPSRGTWYIVSLEHRLYLFIIIIPSYYYYYYATWTATTTTLPSRPFF